MGWILELRIKETLNTAYVAISRAPCQKGPTRYAYASQIGPFWQDTFAMYTLLEMFNLGEL